MGGLHPCVAFELERKRTLDAMRQSYAALFQKKLGKHTYHVQRDSVPNNSIQSSECKTPTCTVQRGVSDECVTRRRSIASRHQHGDELDDSHPVVYGPMQMVPPEEEIDTNTQPLAQRSIRYKRKQGDKQQKIQPPRESLNRFLFSGDERSLEAEMLDDLPIKLHNWYPSEVEKAESNRKLWQQAVRRWIHDHVLVHRTREVIGNDVQDTFVQCGSSEKLHSWSMITKCLEHVHSSSLNILFPEMLSAESLSATATDHPSDGVVCANQLRVISREVLHPFVINDLKEISYQMTRERQGIFDLSCESLSNESGQSQTQEAPESVDVQFDMQRKLYTITPLLNKNSNEEESTMSQNSNDVGNDEEHSWKSSMPVEESSIRISDWHLQKLSELHEGTQLKTHDKPIGEQPFTIRKPTFYEAVYACCLRYESLGGPGHDGAGLQAGIPREIWKVLPTRTFECFASPFNCRSKMDIPNPTQEPVSSKGSTKDDEDSTASAIKRIINRLDIEPVFCCTPNSTVRDVTADEPTLKRRKVSVPEETYLPSPISLGSYYCSFFDEDAYFGSQCSLFKRLPQRGFFEVNPPFDVYVIDKLLHHIQRSFTTCDETDELTYLIIVPEWTPQGEFRKESFLSFLLGSVYLKATAVLRPHKHKYVRGRCWHWSNLTESPKSPGVSKSRATILSNCLSRPDAELYLQHIVSKWNM